MKKRGHYCKVCGEYKANEKFSGKGHAAHICKTCAALPPEKQAEEMALTRLVNLPWRLSKEQLSWLKKRMKDHITTIVKRYKGRIKGWDVVNEAIEDNGAYRKTKFYEILGEEYIPLAFQYAHEADPDAELYYNDYSMAQPGRREAVVKMVNDLKKRGIRIDAIGMQGHIGMDYPKISEFEKSMLAFAGTGVKIMITELDLTVIPSPNPNVGAEVTASFEYKKEMNPYPDGLPEEVSKAWTERMNDFFRLFLKHHNLITRVTLWGVADQNSWRNDWPMRGRTDYPLLFDRNYQPKPVVGLIIKEAEKTK